MRIMIKHFLYIIQAKGFVKSRAKKLYLLFLLSLLHMQWAPLNGSFDNVIIWFFQSEITWPKVITLSGAYCIKNSFINSIAMFFRMTYFSSKKNLSICNTFVCINKSEIFLASFPVFAWT
jgi:hypothetical protein